MSFSLTPAQRKWAYFGLFVLQTLATLATDQHMLPATFDRWTAFAVLAAATLMHALNSDAGSGPPAAGGGTTGLGLLCLAIVGCAWLQGNASDVAGDTGKVLSCEAEGRTAAKRCTDAHADGGEYNCDPDAIQAYKACKAREGI